MSAVKMTQVRFTVPFVASKARPRFSGHAYTDRRTVAREQAIADAYHAVSGGAKAPRDTPVALCLYVHRPLPKRAPKAIQSAPDVTKPDLDNILKLVMDALNGKAWHDDKQVVSISAQRLPKTRGEVPHMEVIVAFPYEEAQ